MSPCAKWETEINNHVGTISNKFKRIVKIAMKTTSTIAIKRGKDENGS